MNKILKLEGGNFEKTKNIGFGAKTLPKDQWLNLSHLVELKNQLVVVYNFWNGTNINIYKLFGDVSLVEIQYDRIISKSNRISRIFNYKGKPDEFIVGSRFIFDGKEPKKHIFTYCVNLENIKNTINLFNRAIRWLQQNHKNKINNDDLKQVNNDPLLRQEKMNSKVVEILVDAFYVEKIYTNEEKKNINNDSIICLYSVKNNNLEILKKIGILNLNLTRFIDQKTQTVVLLDKNQIKILNSKIPYLIAMSADDKQKIFDDTKSQKNIKKNDMSIEDPNNEPIIGVIDGLFNKGVYFSKWVQYFECIDSDIPRKAIDDYIHGSNISSIIVDGHNLNKDLDDGCGRFRVRHFGVMVGKQFSSFIVIKKIEDIVLRNRDIKVWNISLGSEAEVDKNFISFAAAELDRLQNEYKDIIFVISGTNDNQCTKRKFIGSPADSLNSMVVNSVDRENKKSIFSRKGPVLSFFYKPDISYYGESINVCNGYGDFVSQVSGTSYSAPWIARKLAYMIHKLKLSRGTAKALIIDSAASWKRRDADEFIGYGIPPIKINDIIQTQDDEIRFIISSESSTYKTFVRDIPVPHINGSFPYKSRITMCYFPNCSRSQGVDYTDTELDLYFGRIQLKNGKITIHSINKNIQDEDKVVESSARKNYRKWDNVKHINEEAKTRNPKILDDVNKDWGIKVVSKQRIYLDNIPKIKFSVVITLKALDGKNRFNEFVQKCQLNSWIVNEIDVDNLNELYNKAEETIEWN